MSFGKFCARARVAIAIVGLLFASGITGPAFSADCKPQTLLSSLEMGKSNSGRVVVPATFGDTEKYLVLDTGGMFGTLAATFVQKEKFAVRHSMVGQVDVTGHMTNQVARVPSFNLGRIHADGMDFEVDPNEGSFGETKEDVVGILGPNVLQSYDIELDFAHRKVNILSPDHCKGKVIYWPAQAVAAIPFHVSSVGHIYLKAKLDGHEFLAMLDTGASTTFIRLPVAESDFGLKLGSDDTPAAGFLNGRNGMVMYKHRFGQISFNGIAIKNPTVWIIPDMTSDRAAIGTVAKGTRLHRQNAPSGLPDLTVGADILSKLHVYIDYREEMLYLTP